MTRTEFDHHDESFFYRKLVALLHPEGLACPRCGSRQFNQVTSDYVTSVPAYWCRDCTRCFDAWTGTLLQGASCPASEVYRELVSVLDRVARRELRKPAAIRNDAHPDQPNGVTPDIVFRANTPGAEPGLEVK
jgi:hypothetical protein